MQTAERTEEQSGLINDRQSPEDGEPISVINSQSFQSSTDFTVIWHNLTYKADSRRWYSKAKERFFAPTEARLLSEDGIRSNLTLGSRSPREKVILNQICGDAKSRQLTAILGPSGAGKSSLLNCLFQNRTVGTTGQILVDSPSKNKLKVCFIPQHDYLNEWLTVREDLIFVSKLKSARINGLFRDDSGLSCETTVDRRESYVSQVGKDCSTSLIDHEANALCVSELLGLNNCLDVMIKNISGGQKKRLSIARELMSKPDILILDEPTTGLDSLTCYKTVMVLRDLAQQSLNPMAVVVTIHQPQREVFNLFDKTYFISNTGRVIYDDSPKNAVQTIENIAQVQLPLRNYNPASFLIEIASDEMQASVIDRLTIHQQAKFLKRYDMQYLKNLMRCKPGSAGNQTWKFCALNEVNSINSETSLPLQSQSSHIQEPQLLSRLEPKSEYTTVKVVKSVSSEETDLSSDNYFISNQLSNCLSSHTNNLLQSFRHIFILTHRSWLSVIRNPTFTKSRFAFHTILPLMMLVVFGTSMGTPNNCPNMRTELNIRDMSESIKKNLVAKNVDETRSSLENMSFFFILMYGFGINIISCTASFYPLTMHMFKKETSNGLYSLGPYFIGQMLAELPLEIFFPSVSILISYQLSGQISSYLEWRMFSVAFTVFLVSYVIHSLGLLCGSIFVNNVNIALLLGQGLLLPCVMLSGFVIRPARMGEYMRKLSYASPLKHGFNAILSARYGFNVCNCDEETFLPEGESAGFGAMPPNVKHVLDYMFPKSNSSAISNSSELVQDFEISEVFDKLTQRFVKAQTLALDINSCEDVRPYLMYIYDIIDSDLFISVACLILIIILIKFVTYSIMRSFPYRIN